MKIGVILVGHGVPASDCPPRLVGELMGLQWGVEGGHSHGRQGPAAGRVAELDAQIRNWPRRPGNDPYKEGLEQLAEVLKPLLSDKLFALAYNEFCAPTVPEAIESLIRQGAGRVLVVPSMMTPGGVHSEQDIPRSIAETRKRFPQVDIEYIWPFDLKAVASLLADHIRRREVGLSSSGSGR